MLASPLPPSFLDTYSLSTLSLGCNALFMVISFIVLWSICLRSSLVYLKKRPEYLTWDTVQVFIPLMRFQRESFVSSSFLVLLRYSMLAIKRAPADHDTQACCLGPTLCNIMIGHFDLGWYIVALPDPGVVYFLRAWHRRDQEHLKWLYMNSGSQKNPLLFR